MADGPALGRGEHDDHVSLLLIARLWLRLGITGFGGPPAHMALLRRMMVDQHRWMDAAEFEHAVATTNLLPGPSSTQLAIFCGWRLRRAMGGLIAGLCFIVPGLIAIIAAGAAILSSGAPTWLRAAALGTVSVVPAVAVRAGSDLLLPSFRRSKGLFGARARWAVWVAVGGVACLTLGGAIVLALLACGIVELLLERLRRRQHPTTLSTLLAGTGVTAGIIGPLSWTALKVGMLSFGGGFVIVPLMEADAVTRHHWMTSGQFLAAVALGQLTPGPVVQTIAVVGYAAGGLGAALIAASIAFAPSFLMVLGGARAFERLRTNPDAVAFLAGAGPAAIGAIFGTAVLMLGGLSHLWQVPLLALGSLWLLVARRSTVSALLTAAGIGALLGVAGLPSGF